MCTFILAWHVLADVPIAVAANRDEVVDRPSEPPGIYREDPLIVAPRDAEAGGTWIGFNEFGVLVAITNRWTPAELAGERSRGHLVADALACESAVDAVDLVDRETDEREYDGFNLVVVDVDDAVYLEWDGRLSTATLDPGVDVVVNVGRDGDVEVPPHRPEVGQRQAENAADVRAALEPEPDERSDAWLDRAADVLADHDFGVCIHADGFGTRSSSLITLGESSTYRYADGPPCRTPHELVAIESHI